MTTVLRVARGDLTAIRAIGDQTSEQAMRYRTALRGLPAHTGTLHVSAQLPHALPGQLAELPIHALGHTTPRPSGDVVVVEPYNARMVEPGIALFEPNTQYRVLDVRTEPNGRRIVHVTDLHNTTITPAETSILVSRWRRGGTGQRLLEFLRNAGHRIDIFDEKTYPPKVREVTVHYIATSMGTNVAEQMYAAAELTGVPTSTIHRWAAEHRSQPRP